MKSKERFKLLLELDSLVNNGGSQQRIEELRQVLNSSPQLKSEELDEEVQLPFSLEQYLKMRMVHLADKDIRFIYNIDKNKLAKFKKFHQIYVRADLDKQIAKMK